MSLQDQVVSSRHPLWARTVLASAAVAAIAVLGGCTVHVHEHERDYDAPPPRAEAVVVAPAPAVEVVYEPAPPEVVTVYETSLSPHGHWVTIGAYGRCWVWDHRPGGWRPYEFGHWVETDQGMVWVAEGEEAEWGVTCYHYGRWYEDANEGWVWVPGRVWAPSWCAWRVGGGYSCWAPLPPECGDGYAINVEVVNRYVRPERFISVRTQFVTEVNIHEHIEVTNTTIIQKTTNITNITYNGNRAVNRGVPLKNIEGAVHHKIVVEHTATVHDEDEARREVKLGHAVIYSPSAVATYDVSHPVTKHDHRAGGSENHPQGQTAEEKLAEEKANKEKEKEHLTEEHNAKVQTAEEKLAEEKANKEKEKEHLTDEHNTKVQTAEEKLAEEKANKEKEKEHLTDEHNTKVQTAEEKMAEEKANKDKAKEKLDQEHNAKVQSEDDRKAQEKAAKDKAAQDKADEKAAKDKEAQDKLAAERDAKLKTEQEKIDEKAAKDKEAQQKLAEEKAAKDKAAEDKAEEKANKNQGKPGPNNPNNPNDPNNPKKKPNPNDPNAPK